MRVVTHLAAIALLATVTSSCALRASRGNTAQRERVEQTPTREQAMLEQTRIAHLEQLVGRVEQQLEKSRHADALKDKETDRLLALIDRLVALNERQRAEHRTAQAASVEAASVEVAPAVAAAAVVPSICDESLPPDEQLRQFVARLYSYGAPRGGLSLEESHALRVLLRPRRTLDGINPLRP